MKRIIMIAATAVAMLLMAACCPKTEETFTLWQLPSQVNTIGNSYVIQTVNGKLIVMDGGSHQETDYLRGFISALGAEVEAWFISHPHDDHFWALINILKEPGDIKINNIYHSRITPETINTESGDSFDLVQDLYAMFDNSPEYKVYDCHAGDEFEIDSINFKMLSEQNPELKYYNNQSMVIKMWDDCKSFVFLGDLGPEGGRKLMESEYMEDVKCDYLQMSHHGQDGCDKDFYMKAEFRACLWSTPSWVYNNDFGDGFNTGGLKTIEVRDWMKEKGITEHYISYEGLVRIK